MLYLVGSLVLGVLGATGMAIALWGRPRPAALWMLATQPLGTTYDVVTHQYGFLIIAALSSAIAIVTLARPQGGSPSFFSRKADQR